LYLIIVASKAGYPIVSLKLIPAASSYLQVFILPTVSLPGLCTDHLGV
jgi:hypothetical protein